MKENVLIGKLIPAGTGMPMYRDIEVTDSKGNPLEVEENDVPAGFMPYVPSDKPDEDAEDIDEKDEDADDAMLDDEDEPLSAEDEALLSELDKALDSESHKKDQE